MFNPFAELYSKNVSKFVNALTTNSIELVRLFTTETKYFARNTVISNCSLLEIATNFTRFDSWKVIYDYLGGDINNMPKGVYPYDFIIGSGKNNDPRIYNFLITLDIPNKNESATGALNFATSAGHMDTILAILESRLANVSASLHSAVVLNQKMVQLYIKYGADLSYVSNNLDVVTFAMLRDMPHPLLYAMLPDESNAIYYGLYHNDAKLIQSAFEDERKQNFRYKLLPHPVLCAVQYSNIFCIRLVILLYGSYKMYMEPGPMMNKRLGGNENIVNMVVKRPFDLEIYTNIINKPVDRNNVSNHRTPLSAAVREGDLVKVKFLLENGCNPNIITEEGTTLMECIYCCYGPNNLDMMKLLLSHGADYNLCYPQTTEYAPYRGLSALGLCKLMNKPDISLLKF